MSRSDRVPYTDLEVLAIIQAWDAAGRPSVLPHDNPRVLALAACMPHPASSIAHRTIDINTVYDSSRPSRGGASKQVRRVLAAFLSGADGMDAVALRAFDADVSAAAARLRGSIHQTARSPKICPGCGIELPMAGNCDGCPAPRLAGKENPV